ncbi:MAG: hypothetical protein KDD56_06315, partial [Bdellovibrionales bacterium]|nr:hypothetical protein [Bdellovibrionales bacterium]
ALLHDIGHLAPGSHTAFKAWFPDKPDMHEALSRKIISEDSEIQEILNSFSTELCEQVTSILSESNSVPSWTWEIISGGGWNVDRGHWCIADSVLAGVSYGKYNIPAIIDSLCITDTGRLALKENRLDAMMHFVVSRQAMYSQLYHHRVLLAADSITSALVKRARNIKDELSFADDQMKEILNANDVNDLSLNTIFKINEAWFKYHLANWVDSSDSILSDLASRLAYRKLFKTVKIREDDDTNQLWEQANKAVKQSGFDTDYYLSKTEALDIYHGDSKHSVNVQMEDGQIKELAEADPVFKSLVEAANNSTRTWLVMPVEAKKILGRAR